MLLVFRENGVVEFTRNPDALALVAGLGDLNVTRMSDIKFDILDQRYYIQFCTGHFKDFVLRWSGAGLSVADELSALWWDFADQHSPQLVNERVWPQAGGAVQFRTYEDAVAIEVAFIDFLREQNIAVQ